MSSVSKVSSDALASAVLAVRASGLEPEIGRPIEPLASKIERIVCRVHCRDPGPSTVIVKANACVPASVERRFYERVLRRLPVRTPAHYGALEERDRWWLVIEDVGDAEPAWGRHCSRDLAEWLAAAHVAARGLTCLSTSLPDRGPQHYRNLLQMQTTALVGRIDGTSKPVDREPFILAIAACESVAALWDVVTHACNSLEPSIVHGDLAAENLRGICAGPRVELAVIDWEKAGWGSPAVDLARVNVDDYVAALATLNDYRGLDRLRDASWAGQIFRVLTHNFAAKTPKKIEDYAKRLTALVESAP